MGYTDALRSERVEVWSGQYALYPDLVAYFDELHDLSTATMVLGVVKGDRDRARHLDSAAALAAPATALYVDGDWELWAVGTGADGRGATRLEANVEDPSVARFLGPTELRSAKTGGRQLPLFDIEVNLLARTRSRLSDRLDERVRLAMLQIVPGEGDLTRARAEDVSEIVVQALALLAARDKLTEDRTFATAWAVLQDRFPEDVLVHPSRFEQVERLAGLVGEGVNFASLDAGVLGDVYENAILEPARRSELGAFYTPPSLGRRILSTLPVESLPPDQRLFMDITCGSGTLLLAANNRLGELLDGRTLLERQAFLRKTLFGYDADRFAVGLARLALLVHALPTGNGFHVERRDVLASPPTLQADVLVSNPPWAQSHRGGPHQQLADRFLRRIVEACNPGGFLACVLPLSWLSDRTSRASRDWLRSHADVFETWRLPEKIFRTTTWAPCVIFAQKQADRGRFVFRQVSQIDRKAFLEGAPATSTLLGTADTSFGAALTTGAVARRVPSGQGLTLGQFATVRNGAPVDDIKHVREKNAGAHRLLDVHRGIPAFGEVRLEDTIRATYPDDFSKRGVSARPDVYLQSKVLISSIRWQGNAWRMKVLLDSLPVIPRNQLTAVIPHENSATYRLLVSAILGCGVVNLWIDEQSTTRMLSHRALRSLAMPPERHWDTLVEHARELVLGAREGHVARDALLGLEHASWDAYGLSTTERLQVQEALAGRPGPEGAPRFGQRQAETGPAGPEILTPGAVLDVDGARLLLHIPGLTAPEGSWMPPPARMPGWLMRPGATFLARGGQGGVHDAEFAFHRSSWQGADDLLAEFAGWPLENGRSKHP